MVTENHIRAEERESPQEKNRGVLVEAETARAAARRPRVAKPPAQAISLFWQVFGGTIVSVVSLLMITAYSQMTATEAELRRDVSQLQADGVRKEELNTRLTAVWNSMKELEQTRITIVGLTDQARGLGQDLQAHHKSDAEFRQELQRQLDSLGLRLQALAERVASVEAAHRVVELQRYDRAANIRERDAKGAP